MHLRYSFTSLVLIAFILTILLWATVIDILLAATCFIDPLTAGADRHRLLAAFCGLHAGNGSLYPGVSV
jgi:hypothetical protein